MFRFQPEPDRWRLGFLPAVLEAFDFLVTEHGFRCTRQEDTFVCYESSRVFVNVFHGRGSLANQRLLALHDHRLCQSSWRCRFPQPKDLYR